MGQAQSAPAPPANVTPLLSGTADMVQRVSRDLEGGGITGAPLHRWMVGAPHRSIEAAPADQSSTSERDGTLLSSKHSIFLSHSGAQKSFVEQLCLDIERHDRYPFFDKRRDSLAIGDDFPKLIFEAINQCQVGVVVLSEEFFSRSKWPMLELAAMVKRRARDPKFVIMPVFLGVGHAQCRDKVNQARWLRIWQGWARVDKRIKVQEWKEALRVFGYTNGISLNNELDEVKCREEITTAVCKRVQPNTRWDDSHVQGLSRMSLCKGRLKQDLKKKVVLTIDNVSDTQEIVNNAKEILRLGFIEGSIVIVTARSLAQLQNLNLEDWIQMPELEEEDARSLFLHHVAPGLYLDNVGKFNKRALKRCIERCYFGKGNGMYHYHPLALKVLGGQLGNKPDEWMAKLDLYEGDPFNQYEEEEKDHPIFSILGRSFELLKYEDQLLFMDATMFFPHSWFGDHNIFEWLSMTHGKSMGEVMRRLELLKSKSLVEDLGNGRERIALHDLWLEFVGMKAKASGFDQRPWMNETVYGLNDPQRKESVLCGGGWKNLQRISMVGVSDECERIVKELSLSRCSNLRVLKLVNIDKIETQVLDLRSVTQLKSLQVRNYERLEVYFLGLGCLRNLAYLDLFYISTDSALLHEEIASLTNLQVLHVGLLSHKIKSGRLTSQKEERSTAQKWGGEARSVGQSTGDAAGGTLERENGESGSLAGAEQQTLATGTGKPTRKDPPEVEEQALTESPSAGNARAVRPVSSSLDLSRMNLLRDMRFFACEGVHMISGLTSRMTRLKRLDLSWCSSLLSCHGVGDLVALEELDLSMCSKLEEVPNLGRLKNLLKLRVRGCEFIEAVPGLGDLVSLQVFEAYDCHKLAELPDMRKLVNLRTLDVRRCPLIEAMPGLSYLIGLRKLLADFDVLRGCHDLLKLKTLELVKIRGWGAGGIPCLSDLRSLKSLRISSAKGVDELTFVSNSTRLRQLLIEFCGFKDVPCLSDLTRLKSFTVLRCNQLERLPDMHKLSRLEMLDISYCKNLREWDSGSGLRQFGEGGRGAGALAHARTLRLTGVALLTELPDLSRFPHLTKLRVDCCEKLTSLTSSAPMTALEDLSLVKCGVVRALRSQLDLSDLVSPRSLKLCRSGTLQLMAHEIGELQAMCPGPGLGTQLGSLQHMELESDE